VFVLFLFGYYPWHSFNQMVFRLGCSVSVFVWRNTYMTYILFPLLKNIKYIWNSHGNRFLIFILFSVLGLIELYHGDTKLYFNNMMMVPVLYYTNTLSPIIIVLAHWNNSPGINMSLHSDTLSWFRANQSLLFLLNDVCLAEKQGLKHTLGDHSNHYTWCV